MPLSAPATLARRIWRVTLVLVVGGWALLLALWLVLHAVVLAHLDTWRPRIEAAANQRLAAQGLRLHVASLSAESDRWVPVFTAQGITLTDAQGQTVLRLPRVTAMLSARSLLVATPLFRQIVIDAPWLTAHRDAQGRWHVAGMPLQPGAASDTGALDWLLRQREVVIRSGQIHWQDDGAARPPVVLTDVDLLLRNRLRHHAWRLDATPPAAWGQRLSLRGDFKHPLLNRPGDLTQWHGTLYADAPLLDAAALAPHLTLPVEMGTGRGALRAWLARAPGQWQAATLDAALADVQGRAAAGLPRLQWAQWQGRLSVARDGDGYRATTHAVQGRMADGTPWPAGDVTLTWRQRPGSTPGDVAAVQGGRLAVPALELQGATELAVRLPLPERARKALQDVAPQGRVTALELRWDGPPDAPTAWQGSLAAQALALRPEHAADPKALGRPGVRGATLSVQASHTGGSADVRILDGALTFPGVFDQPDISLTQAQARLSWTLTPRPGGGAPDVALTVREATFANADAQGRLSGRWRTGGASGIGRGQRLPGHIELDGVITQGRGTQVVRYLPLDIPADVRHYVASAVRSGQIEQARFRVAGDLWDFPYTSGEPGEFRIQGRVRGLELAYVPPGLIDAGDAGWPPFTDVAGELVFDRARMQIKDASARLWGVALTGVQGEIPNLVADAPELRVQGSGRGPLTDALRFLEATPIAGWMNHALAQTQASGDAGLDLTLAIPLLNADATRLQGRITLAGNTVRLRPEAPQMVAASGDIAFTERDFQLKDGRAQVLGGPATFAGGSQPDGSLRFTGEGLASAEGLRAAREWGDVTQAARALRGEAAYTMVLTLRGGQPELRVDSSLQGLAIDLPAPLAKPAMASWPLRMATTLDARATHDTLDVKLADVLHARYERALGDGPAQVLRGGIAVGRAEAPLPQRGVQARIDLPALDADAWRQAFATLAAEPGPAAASAYAPSDVQLAVADLTAAGLHWPDQRIQARPGAEAGQWVAALQGPHAQGRIDASPARIKARLERLVLERVDESSPGPHASAPTHAAERWPALDLVVDALTWQDQPWGRLALTAQSHAKTWQVDELVLSGPSATLNATGRWVPGAHTELEGTLTLADGGRLIEHMGLGALVRGGKGQIGGKLSWPGDPSRFALARLDGALALDVGRGQFLQAEPGAARLLGILNLQALPRRLMLDFRDVFATGFAFDQIDGQITLHGGLARTSNLRIRGVQAAVLVEGVADLGRETQDLHVVIVPEINAGTASLAYAVINPALGLGSFLAQYLLRKPLQDAGTRELRITGTWDEPQMQTLNRKEPAP